MNNEKQIRDLKTSFTLTRAEESDQEKIIEGYFALYEEETELFTNNYEIITKGAFNKTLENDIRALWNHDTKNVLGRTKNNSLELRTDEKGLYGIIRLPPTNYANDLWNLVKRGDIDQASFGFNILNETLEETEKGFRWRINDIDLHEISVVTFPAYGNTSIQARQKQIEEEHKNLQFRKLEEKKAMLLKRLGGQK